VAEIVRPAPRTRLGITTAAWACRRRPSGTTSSRTRAAGWGERITTRSQAESGANSTFRPGRPWVKPLPASPSVSMNTKTIWTAKPTPIRQGSWRLEFTVTSKVTLSPFCLTVRPVRSKEPRR
jgi:hypothetical protein